MRVNLLYELENGYICFGTSEGLFRYDGLEFEQILMPDSLTNNQVSAIIRGSRKQNMDWVIKTEISFIKIFIKTLKNGNQKKVLPRSQSLLFMTMAQAVFG